MLLKLQSYRTLENVVSLISIDRVFDAFDTNLFMAYHNLEGIFAEELFSTESSVIVSFKNDFQTILGLS